MSHTSGVVGVNTENGSVVGSDGHDKSEVDCFRSVFVMAL